ncbi:MAG TPA: lipopolysaccharide assembly protein LapA domain-containing protein [Pseudomonadales bacterium]
MIMLKKLLLLLLLLATCGYTLAFVLVNQSQADIDFVLFSVTAVPVELLVLASFVAGGLLGLLSAGLLLLKARQRYRQLLKNTRTPS